MGTLVQFKRQIYVLEADYSMHRTMVINISKRNDHVQSINSNYELPREDNTVHQLPENAEIVKVDSNFAKEQTQQTCLLQSLYVFKIVSFLGLFCRIYTIKIYWKQLLSTFYNCSYRMVECIFLDYCLRFLKVDS